MNIFNLAYSDDCSKITEICDPTLVDTSDHYIEILASHTVALKALTTYAKKLLDHALVEAGSDSSNEHFAIVINMARKGCDVIEFSYRNNHLCWSYDHKERLNPLNPSVSWIYMNDITVQEKIHKLYARYDRLGGEKYEANLKLKRMLQMKIYNLRPKDVEFDDMFVIQVGKTSWLCTKLATMGEIHIRNISTIGRINIQKESNVDDQITIES